MKAGSLELDVINTQDLAAHHEAWEKVALKLRAHQMPPLGARQPAEGAHTAALTSLEAALDGLSAAAPNPGRTDTFRRLNRTEYRNAIRDLLALDVDVAALLPSDSASFGFDNVTVGNLSPTLLESYVSAAEKISQLAVGRPGLSVGGTTVRIKPDITQEGHIDGLPLGTRGGALVSHTFPVNGEYEITIRLARDRNEHIEGLFEPHEVELLVDGEQQRAVYDRAYFTLAGRFGVRRALARDAGQPHEGAVAGECGTTHSGRHVPEEAVADPRNRASALRGAFQLLPSSASAAGGLRDFDRRSVQPCWRRRHAEPPAGVHVPSRHPRRMKTRAPRRF